MLVGDLNYKTRHERRCKPLGSEESREVVKQLEVVVLAKRSKV
jgi:hypothetical protein